MKPNPVARKIVAELLWRERFAKRMLSRALLDDREIPRRDLLIANATSLWAEAHNAATISKKILFGHDIE